MTYEISQVKLRRNSGFHQFCCVFFIGFFLGVSVALQATIGTLLEGDDWQKTFGSVNLEALWEDQKASSEDTTGSTPA